MKKQKPKCMFVYAADALHCSGGVQKVFCALASALVEKGWDIAAVIESKTNRPPFYPLDSRVRLINAAPKLLFRFGKTIRKRIIKWFYPALLRRENPDVVLCFSWNDLERVPAGYPTVLMQHVPPRIALKKTHRPAVRNRYLTLLKHTSRVQVLLPSFQEEMRVFCPNIPITCIGNAVDQLPPRPPHSNDHPPVVLSVGRLDENKNQLLLIRAFDLVRRQIPDARLILCGDNADSKYGLACRAETAALGLEQNITFHPPTTNLVPLYHQADIYASASLFEGWGLTVTEAMSVGLPVVGLKSADGVNALVQDGTTGFLTDNDPRDFAQALLRLIHSPDDRRRFGHAARRALHAFAPDTVWAQWDCLLRSVAFPKKSTEKD